MRGVFLVSTSLVSLLMALFMPAPLGAQRAPRLEAFELRGALQPKAARPALARALPGLSRCFEEASAKPAGTLGARLLIVSDGRVLAGEIDSSSITERAVERCLLDALRSIRFPSVDEFEESHLMLRISFGGSAGEERRSNAGPGDPRFDEEDEGRAPRPESRSERDIALSIQLREGALTDGERALVESRLDRAARACQRAEREDAQRGARLSLRLSIRQGGRVDSLDAVYSNASSTLERCLLERISKLIFPEAPIEIEAQFLFVSFERARREPSR